MVQTSFAIALILFPWRLSAATTPDQADLMDKLTFAGSRCLAKSALLRNWLGMLAGIDENCPLRKAIDAIGGRWKTIIVYHLLKRAYYFGELQRTLGDISPKVLTEKLRELEQIGIIERTPHEDSLKRVEYSITPRGQTLNGIIRCMIDWGEAEAAPENDAESVSTKALR